MNTKTKKGFYSGNKQIKKELGIRNSMVEFENMITATTSNGNKPRFPRYACARIEIQDDGTELYMPIDNN